MNTTLPTVAELLADVDLLRRVAGSLEPGPWKHDPDDASSIDEGWLRVCGKECGAEQGPDLVWYAENGEQAPNCPIPDPAAEREEGDRRREGN